MFLWPLARSPGTRANSLQCLPCQAASQSHRPETQRPLREQSESVLQSFPAGAGVGGVGGGVGGGGVGAACVQFATLAGSHPDSQWSLDTPVNTVELEVWQWLLPLLKVNWVHVPVHVASHAFKLFWVVFLSAGTELKSLTSANVRAEARPASVVRTAALRMAGVWARVSVGLG